MMHGNMNGKCVQVVCLIPGYNILIAVLTICTVLLIILLCVVHSLLWMIN